MTDAMERLGVAKIGILGCGHLGRAIAQALLDRGLEKKNLLVSYRGDPLTAQKLEEMGLGECAVSNRRLFEEADIALITVRPIDVLALKDTAAAGKALVVSCMAGAPVGVLRGILGTDVYRMMLSGPDTLLCGKGVATMYPECARIRSLLDAMQVEYIKTVQESDLDVFTAGVCFPAAILKAPPDGQAEAVARIAEEYPLIARLYEWAVGILPAFESEEEKETYIRRMVTKGGVTEAIISSLEGGAPLDAACRAGIARAGEIRAEVAQSVTAK